MGISCALVIDSVVDSGSELGGDLDWELGPDDEFEPDGKVAPTDERKDFASATANEALMR